MSEPGAQSARDLPGLVGGAEHAARVSYDRVAEAYAKQVGPLARADVEMGAMFHDLVTRAAEGAHEEPVIADIGCGPGWWTRHMQDAGARAVGVDLSTAMVALGADEGGARFVAGAASALPFAAGAFDGVSLWYVLHHIDDAGVQAALSEARRVCRPGGELLIGGHVGEGARLKREGYGDAMEVLVVKRLPSWWERVVSGNGFEVHTHTLEDGGRQHVLTARAR